MDGNGHLDIVVAQMHQATEPQEVCVYRNQGRGEARRKQVVSTQGSHKIVLVDIVSNGRTDIPGANWNNRSSTKSAIDLRMNGP
jgi:hypothetical protein